eukprot:796598-Amorphochlora_amoeboformis.AAC.1
MMRLGEWRLQVVWTIPQQGSIQPMQGANRERQKSREKSENGDRERERGERQRDRAQEIQNEMKRNRQRDRFEILG